MNLVSVVRKFAGQSAPFEPHGEKLLVAGRDHAEALCELEAAKLPALREEAFATGTAAAFAVYAEASLRASRALAAVVPLLKEAAELRDARITSAITRGDVPAVSVLAPEGTASLFADIADGTGRLPQYAPGAYERNLATLEVFASRVPEAEAQAARANEELSACALEVTRLRAVVSKIDEELNAAREREAQLVRQHVSEIAEANGDNP